MTDQLLENQKPEKEPKKKPQKTPPPIWVPITLVICAYIWGLLLQFKWEVERAIYMITHAPDVLFEAFGMFLMLVLGLIYLVISQFFKSKRNSYSRRYIIIYWSLAAFVILLLASYGQAEQMQTEKYLEIEKREEIERRLKKSTKEQNKVSDQEELKRKMTEYYKGASDQEIDELFTFK